MKHSGSMEIELNPKKDLPKALSEQMNKVRVCALGNILQALDNFNKIAKGHNMLHTIIKYCVDPVSLSQQAWKKLQ